MCGIVGFNWIDEKLINKLTDSLKHRGPDARGIYTNGTVSLGHRRLKVLDLSDEANQPMMNQTQDIVVVFNGEIFNFQELKNKLIDFGYKFKTSCDTEVIVHGYDHWGQSIFRMLNGQFAIAVYDRKKNYLVLARDRAGIIPLFFQDIIGKFIFGSQPRAILKSGQIPLIINHYSFQYYMMYGYTPLGQTIFDRVYEFKPGYSMTYDLKRKRMMDYTPYFDIKKESTQLNFVFKEEEYVKELKELLDESVKQRMVADVPVGAFLSGGLDSSTIVHFASKYTDKLNTFSIKFDYDDFDESKWAETISKKYNTKHHVIKFTAKDVQELLEELPNYFDEPFADHSVIPTYLVSKVAKKHVTVSLSGDGADELFAGYNKYKTFRLVKKVNYIKYPAQLFAPICSFNKNLHRFLLYSKLKDFEKYANIGSYIYIEELKSYHKILYESFEKYFKIEGGVTIVKPDWLTSVLNIDFENYLPEDILTKVDRAAMAHALETRPPFLDNKIIDFATTLKSKHKLKGDVGKYILKKTMRGLLPNEIIDREKKGFGSPIKHYFRNELKEFVKKWTVDYNKHTEFEDLNINKIYEDHINGKEDYSRLLFSILMFNMWYEKWMVK